MSLSILALILIVASAGPLSRRSTIPFVWWLLATIAAVVIGLFISAMWVAANIEMD